MASQITNNTFAQPAFKQELCQQATAMTQSETYQSDAHKLVAMDAAVMAASKSSDFAKVAAAGFPVPSDSNGEGIMEVAKEKFNDTLDSLSWALEGAKEKIDDTVDMIVRKMSLPGDGTDVQGTTPDNSGKPFARFAFKQELAREAEKMTTTSSYQSDARRLVAKDAAIMAASKSGDFARAAEADFPTINKPVDEGYLEMAKEKLGKTMGVVREKLGEGLDFIFEQFSGRDLNEVEATRGTMGNYSYYADKPLAQTAFKQELASKADTFCATESYQSDAHKLVAKDAAVMAASKSCDFAREAAAGFPNTNVQDEPSIIDTAKDTLASAQQTMSETVGSVKNSTGQVYTSTVNSLGGAVEAAKETFGGSLEYIAEKMQSVGDSLSSKAMETKEKGVQLKREAELNQARLNLQSPQAI